MGVMFCVRFTSTVNASSIVSLAVRENPALRIPQGRNATRDAPGVTQASTLQNHKVFQGRKSLLAERWLIVCYDWFLSNFKP